jgi:outer membrane immunogenic protein
LLGYNWQKGNLVYGVEVDFGMVNADAGPNINPGFNEFSAFDVDWNAHMRARIGKSVGKSLFYAAGGLAVASLNIDDTDPGWGEVDSSHVGWSIGGGFAHAFTDKLSLHLEYLYDDYGSEDGEQSFDGVPVIDFTTSPTAQAVRAALSYRF